jgi:hypothetical protein
MPKPPYPLHPEPMTRSWLERHPLWKIPLGFLTLIGLLAAYGTFVAAMVTGTIRHSDPYKQAMVLAAGNPQVREQVGEPIQAGWLAFGDLHTNGSAGHANFQIPITGSNGSGRIRVIARRNDYVWRFTCLQVEVSGRVGSIDLLTAVPRE